MTLVDAGPLIALLDRGDTNHARCTAALQELSGPLVTTWPCFTEAMYFAGRAGGWPVQQTLWNLQTTGRLMLYPDSGEPLVRIQALMAQYKDTPMDLADASLAAVAEAVNQRRIFTLDSDFRVYRIHGTHAFEVVPE